MLLYACKPDVRSGRVLHITMKSLNRRRFLRTSCLSAVSLGFLPSLRVHAASKAGANEEIRYAVVGFNGRGMSHIEGMRKVKGTRLIALCDADRSVLDRELKKGEQ